MGLLLFGYIYVWRKGALDWGNELTAARDERRRAARRKVA
jgi:hypothetical protein